MSGPRPSELRCFNENSPRPPVPGEEGEGQTGRCQSSSPEPAQPRRSSSCDAAGAPLGFEPEGRCDHAVLMEKNPVCGGSADTLERGSATQMACLQWSRSLHALLEDPKGLELFEHYLQQEGTIYALSFWFACEGLKEERDSSTLTTIIKVLIRRFFHRQQLPLPEDVRKELTRCFQEGLIDRAKFDKAQEVVERYIEDTSYRNFLTSELYIQYVSHCECVEKGLVTVRSRQDDGRDEEVDAGVDENECTSSPDEPPLSCASNLLPTLHEDSEFSSQRQQEQLHHQLTYSQQQQQLHHHQQQQQQQQQRRDHHHHHHSSSALAPTEYNKGEMRLTKDMLMATQQIRALETRPKPEAYAGIYLQRGASPYHASLTGRPRAGYSSYNPVSRQDSELQSLSSDARTESDNLSLTDVSLSDSASISRRSRKQYIRQYQAIKKSAMVNREHSSQDPPFIPRTQKITREQTQPKDPETFARELIEKLERVKRDRDNEEKLERKLREVDRCTDYSDSTCGDSTLIGTVIQMSGGPLAQTVTTGHQQSRGLTEDLREKLQLDEDINDQEILDQHVSRVWSDLTPSRSPKLSSPRPRSPDKSRRQLQQQAMSAASAGSSSSSHAYPSRPPSYRSQRKEKDVFSTFSGDSGNVHDFPESGELHGAGSMSSLGSHLPKSKSVPSDYADSLHTQDLYLQGQDPRFRRLDAQRSSSTKKSMTELTDSGVSVVSDISPKDTRLLTWWKRSDGNCSAKTEMTMPNPKLRKKFPNLPQQPFVGDPGMPLLPQPHTPTQLEEAKRRLEYEELARNRQRYPGSRSAKEYEQPSSMQQTCAQSSSQSTLRRGKQEAVSDFTTVVFSFCDEKVPYRTKIVGQNVTLKQFKDVLPKKGSYRYFFKTECEDLDMQVIQEEVTDDGEVLPLWEGKIMAQVKALE